MTNQGFWTPGMQGTVDRMNAGLLQRGTLANRPAAGQDGRIYWATNTEELFLDDGVDWTKIELNLMDVRAGFSGSLVTTTSTSFSEPDSSNYVVTVPKSGTYVIIHQMAIGLSSAGTLDTQLKQDTSVFASASIVFGSYNDYPTNQFVPITIVNTAQQLDAGKVIHFEWKLASSGPTASMRHRHVTIIRRTTQ
ncbi:MAG: hypothetical protein L0177_07610 [Chloroflexi bacterium]|nr:hypothetical protein [Chloroflexota bacterium]